MDVRCERCRAQYVFDDDQVTAAGLTVSCSHCGHRFRVKKKEFFVTVPVQGDDPAPPPPAPPPPAAPEPPLPVHDVDVTFEDEAPPRRKGGSRSALLVAALVVLAAVAAALGVQRLLARPAPAPVVAAPPPAPPAEPRPAPPPEPEKPPEPPAPVAAPEPVVQEGVPAPPAPIVRPAPPAPRGPKALLARARALHAKGDAEAALELFGRVASDDPGNVEAQTGRGLCYLDLENWAPAEASFQAALRLEPDHADALLGLGETYRFQGKKAEAIPVYERYLARYPDGDEAQVAKNALAELRK